MFTLSVKSKQTLMFTRSAGLTMLVIFCFYCKLQTLSHQGKRIEERSSGEESGLIISGKSLVLQGVKRQQAGNYTCIVSNLEGDAESNSVILQILCEFSQLLHN